MQVFSEWLICGVRPTYNKCEGGYSILFERTCCKRVIPNNRTRYAAGYILESKRPIVACCLPVVLFESAVGGAAVSGVLQIIVAALCLLLPAFEGAEPLLDGSNCICDKRIRRVPPVKFRGARKHRALPHSVVTPRGRLGLAYAMPWKFEFWGQNLCNT